MAVISQNRQWQGAPGWLPNRANKFTSRLVAYAALQIIGYFATDILASGSSRYEHAVNNVCDRLPLLSARFISCFRVFLLFRFFFFRLESEDDGLNYKALITCKLETRDNDAATETLVLSVPKKSYGKHKGAFNRFGTPSDLIFPIYIRGQVMFVNLLMTMNEMKGFLNGLHISKIRTTR